MPIFKLFSVLAKSIIIQLWNVISFNEELVFLEQNLSSRFLLSIWCWKEHHLQVKYKLNVTNLSIIGKLTPLYPSSVPPISSVRHLEICEPPKHKLINQIGHDPYLLFFSPSINFLPLKVIEWCIIFLQIKDSCWESVKVI